METQEETDLVTDKEVVQVGNVDKTIEKICEWIEKSLDTVESTEESIIISAMIKALAELVSANAGRTYNIDSKKLSETIIQHQRTSGARCRGSLSSDS